MYPRFDVCLYIRTFTPPSFKPYVNLAPQPAMEPKTIEQEAIVRLLGSSRSQVEWDKRVKTILTVHCQNKLPRFWVDLVIKSDLYFRTRQKWIHRRLNSR